MEGADLTRAQSYSRPGWALWADYQPNGKQVWPTADQKEGAGHMKSVMKTKGEFYWRLANNKWMRYHCRLVRLFTLQTAARATV